MNDKQATSEYQKYKRSENAYGKFDTVISDQKEKKKKIDNSIQTELQ